jgi:peptidylprolyl isomerase
MDRRTGIVLVLAALAIGVAAVLGSSGGSSNVSSTKDLAVKPVVPKQSGTAPTTLKIDDIVKGTGAEAKSGDKATMRYVGVLYDGGDQFDASWDRTPNSFPFTIGNGEVIKCWDEGVVGMKVGGRRQLTCPSDLAYGPQGSPPTIPANAPLVFVVDLTKVGPGTTAAPGAPAAQ